MREFIAMSGGVDSSLCAHIEKDKGAECNKRIKFGLLFDYAVSGGFDILATGHYSGRRKDYKTVAG